MVMYNMNGFGTETMYDYYIAMKSMFLVAKSFYHPSIVYASLTFLLSWSKHKQHQNHSKPKAFQNQNFNSHKLCIHSITLYKWRWFLRSQTPPYILTKRKPVKKLLKFIHHKVPQIIKKKQNHKVPHVIPQLITCCTCDSTINHMLHMWFHN